MLKLSQEDVYTIMVSGFDAELYFTEEDENIMDVTLFEAGAEVFDTQIDVTSFIDDEGDTYTEDLLIDVAQAAVDLFEASRDTLGEGAEVLETQAMKKKSYLVTADWEDWFMNLRGTTFEDQATSLFEQYLELHSPAQNDVAAELSASYLELEEVEWKLDMLNFERMKMEDPSKTVIIIDGKGKLALDVQGLGEYLSKFERTKLESQALGLVQECLGLRAKITELQGAQEDTWQTKRDLENAMHEVFLQATQQNMQLREEEQTVLDMVPSMANDIVELMHGVDFDEPLEPMSEGLVPPPMDMMMEEQPAEEEMLMSVAFKRAQDQSTEDEVRMHIVRRIEQEIRETDAGYLDEYDWWSAVADFAGENLPPEYQNPTVEECEEVVRRLQIDKHAKRRAQEKPKQFEEQDLPEGIRADGEEPLETSNESGLDIAEVEVDERPFNQSERVELSKEYTVSMWGGMKIKYPKGTKGTIDGLFDRHGDQYLIMFDSGKLTKVPYTHLKRLKKGQ